MAMDVRYLWPVLNREVDFINHIFQSFPNLFALSCHFPNHNKHGIRTGKIRFTSISFDKKNNNTKSVSVLCYKLTNLLLHLTAVSVHGLSDLP